MTTTTTPANLPGAVSDFPVIGILRGFAQAQALQIAQVAAEAGLAAIEITMNSPGAAEQLSALAETLGTRTWIGAGTVTTHAELHTALAAGARFIVTPVTDLDLIRECVQAGVPIFPGAMTPSEITAAWRAGATMVKLFPAAQLGPAYVKAVRAPLSHIPLLPTGGIDLDNARDFLRAGAAGLGVGSPLFQPQRMADADWPWLRERIRAFRQLFAA